ncbi:unnamed protein product [Sphagnum troendelagicum]|uniref:BZIP domain-containing protein n=1 Tax=Sphagnum troendelagicum TaxID=128251 RepID=A0ABP0UME4_9BRYO
MNDLEAEDDKDQWVDSEADLASEAYSSESDDTDAEVPEVTDPVAAATSTIVQGAEDRKLKLTPVRGSIKENVKETELGKGWKPVIGGKLQVQEDRAQMQAATAGAAFLSPSPKQTSSEKSISVSEAPASSENLKKDGNESDSDVRRVPEMSGKGLGSGAGSSRTYEKSSAGPSSRKRGGASADKEHKRLKRLLRNRVSAQQARERKKAYLSDLEVRSKELEQRNAELEEQVSTLQRENQMLRQIVKNTTLKKNTSGGSPGV